MSKFKILIGDKDALPSDTDGDRDDGIGGAGNEATSGYQFWAYWFRHFSPLSCDGHFETRAEATRFYNALIQKVEDDIKKAQQRLNALVENGHIVEVE
tara:strand:- start:53 stop:346 length:294 start_codon:yes stop_codon:yes gene_type:complete